MLIKILAAGVCHSDVALLNAPTQTAGFNEKYTLGHEGCGEIVEVGEDVGKDGKGEEFKVGEKVVILSVAGCGKSDCPECSKDLAQICNQGEKYGIGNDGSYAPYIAIKARAAARLPEGVSVEQGAVATDAVMTAYHAVVRTGRVQKAETILIFGLGGLGFNALQIARHLGARVICVDTREEVLEEAVRFGVDKEDVVPVGMDVEVWVRERALVVDTVIDFVGVDGTFGKAQKVVRMAGKIVLVGLLAPKVTIESFVAVRKHLSILCSYGGTITDLRDSLKLTSKGVVKPQVVTGRLDSFAEVLKDLHEGRVKSRIALVP
jgi:alcohol dehydrogenase, propanol-preferring